MPVFYTKDFESYIPVLDPRRLAKPAIINGVNFLFDIDGPRSAFATNYANFVQFDVTSRVKPVPLASVDGLWYGTPAGLFKIDPTSGELVPLLTGLGITNTFWPWTAAECGGLYYYAQKGIGLWQYTPTTNTFVKITTPVVDANIKFVCAAQGRLMVLCDNSPADLVIWSALDNGADFTPSLVTSAGFQTVGLTGRTGYRVDAVDDGVIISTEKGLLKGTYTGANFLWQWKTLSTVVKVFSPNAGILIPDVGVVLIDKTGMYITNGGKPEPWQQLQGEFFKDQFLSSMTLTKLGCIGISYSEAMKALFVSFADNSHEGNFTATYVYLTISEKWGVCNKSAWGFFDVILPVTGVRWAGMMDYNGYMQYFVEAYQTDGPPASPYGFNDLVWRPDTEQTMLTVSGVQYAYTEIHFDDYLPPYYNNLVTMGVYAPDWSVNDNEVETDFDFEDPDFDPLVDPTAYVDIIFFEEGSITLRPMAYQLPKLGLNSFIEVGPYRYPEQQFADETSMITGLIIGISPVVAFSIFEDWLLLSGDEDWLSEDGYDDWGAGSGLPDVFSLQYTATNDGTNAQLQGAEDLYVVNNMGGSLMYSPMGFSAIYHRFKLSAIDPGEGFALKYFDIAGQSTGRLTFNG